MSEKQYMTVERIVGKLTEAQRRALRRIEPGSESRQCAYTLRVGLNTLEALHGRKLLSKHAGIGSMFSPQTAVLWRLTSLGAQVRDHLTKEGSDHAPPLSNSMTDTPNDQALASSGGGG